MRDTTALLTDRYELTMASAWLAQGMADIPAVFEVFTRRLPAGRRYAVVAGTGRLLDLIQRFRFDEATLEWLMRSNAVTPECARWLADYRFRGDIHGYREGEVYYPGSPILTVSGGLAECAVLETLVLSVLNHDGSVASAAARMSHVSRGRTLIEMGSRRAHEDAAIAAARAAVIAGFDTTSNLAAGRHYAIATAGTAAHAFVLSFDDERSAFAAQVQALGVSTTLLVDTFDITRGIDLAIEVAGPALGGIRIDSGDPVQTIKAARSQLDSLGAFGTQIVISGDLNEYAIDTLADYPVDAFGVGTSVVTGSGHPTAGLVYKLVAVGDRRDFTAPLRPVAKASAGKAGVGGRKYAIREIDASGHSVAEWISADISCAASLPRTRPLQVPMMISGDPVRAETLAEIRAFHRQARGELPDDALDIRDGSAQLVATVRR